MRRREVTMPPRAPRPRDRVEFRGAELADLLNTEQADYLRLLNRRLVPPAASIVFRAA
jgi:hypothetical protein